MTCNKEAPTRTLPSSSVLPEKENITYSYVAVDVTHRVEV